VPYFSDAKQRIGVTLREKADFILKSEFLQCYCSYLDPYEKHWTRIKHLLLRMNLKIVSPFESPFLWGLLVMPLAITVCLGIV